MTVKELIHRLSMFDQDLPVVSVYEGQMGIDVTTERVFLAQDHLVIDAEGDEEYRQRYVDGRLPLTYKPTTEESS